MWRKEWWMNEKEQETKPRKNRTREWQAWRVTNDESAQLNNKSLEFRTCVHTPWKHGRAAKSNCNFPCAPCAHVSSFCFCKVKVNTVESNWFACKGRTDEEVENRYAIIGLTLLSSCFSQAIIFQASLGLSNILERISSLHVRQSRHCKRRIATIPKHSWIGV